MTCPYGKDCRRKRPLPGGLVTPWVPWVSAAANVGRLLLELARHWHLLP